jgi:putative aldouronate transport system substrate-binding protein
MLASGNIPDVYLLRKAMNNLQLYAVKGYTKDITALVEKDDNIQNTIDKNFIDFMRVNEEIHGIPRYKPMTKVMWIRKDIIQSYGIDFSETPTTDEFLNGMKELANKNVIPFSFPKFLDNLPFFYNAFNAYGGIAKDSNGLYYDGFKTVETKQALNYMKTLYNEGIWDKEFATNDNSIIREKLFSGKAVSNIDYINRYIYYMSEGVARNPAFNLQPIYMLKGPKGGLGNLNEGAQDAFVVSPKCKNPETAVSFISWLTTSEEYTKMNLVGIEGKHYTVENGIIKATEIAKASGYKAAATNVITTHKRVTDFGFKWDAITEKYFPKQEAIAKDNTMYFGPNTIIPGGISDLYDNNASKYNEKVQSLAYKVITGAISIENYTKEYEEFWKSIHGDEMLMELNKGK